MNRFHLASYLIMLAVLLGVVSVIKSDTAAQTDFGLSPEDWLQQMSLEQKVAQMFMVNLFGSQLTESGRAMLESWQPGAIVLLKLNTEQTPAQVAALVRSYQQTIVAADGVPLFVAVDQEGGLIQRLQHGFTTWPVPMLLTAADDTELVANVGLAMGRELHAIGVNMNLAPVADLYTNIRNPIIGRRSFGSYPQQVGRTLTALVEGLQSAGVVATLKHFPGHGDTSEDSHTTLPVLSLDRPRLYSRELVPFELAMNAGAVLVSHIWLPAFDEEEVPASLSGSVVDGLLRTELGYKGIVMTDALDMDAIDMRYSLPAAAVAAVIAGNDLIVIGANVGEQMQALAMQAVVDAVKVGRIEEERINQSVERILTTKQQYGILDWQPTEFDSAAFDVLVSSHEQLVSRVFESGVTVVTNSSLLPISSDQQVGVIFPGTRYGIRGICESYRDGVIWLARSETPDEVDIAVAIDLAARVDRVIVFTHDAFYSSAQTALVTSLPPRKTIVVALSSPFDLAGFPEVGGYVATYSPLDAGIVAACGILFGATEASGIFPVDIHIALQSP